MNFKILFAFNTKTRKCFLYNQNSKLTNRAQRNERELKALTGTESV
jgi:hypothetical protein